LISYKITFPWLLFLVIGAHEMLKEVLFTSETETLAGPTLGPNNRNTNKKKVCYKGKTPSFATNSLIYMYSVIQSVNQSDNQSVSQLNQ